MIGLSANPLPLPSAYAGGAAGVCVWRGLSWSGPGARLEACLQPVLERLVFLLLVIVVVGGQVLAPLCVQLDRAILERLYTYEFCSPSRSSLLSGRMPQHVNIHNDDQTRPGAGIPVEMATIPSKLREAGYRTHHLGKWHVGYSTPQHTPMHAGG